MGDFVFGVFPGIVFDAPDGKRLGSPSEDRVKTLSAIDALRGGKPFYVRAYRPFKDAGAPAFPAPTPAEPARYLGNGRALDLVLQFQSQRGDLDGWLRFVRESIRGLKGVPGKVQIGEEPNVGAPQDGGCRNVVEAIVSGVIAGKAAARSFNPGLKIGFNAAPSRSVDDDFWKDLRKHADAEFFASLDYVGLDCFPDVFRPLPSPGLEEAVEFLLKHFREILTTIGVPETVPIHLTEHGWPTGPEHSEARQAEALEAVIRAVHARRDTYNVRAYELFALRDWVSSADRFSCFGVLRDDYSAKPAFERYQALIAELG